MVKSGTCQDPYLKIYDQGFAFLYLSNIPRFSVKIAGLCLHSDLLSTLRPANNGLVENKNTSMESFTLISSVSN